MAEKKMKKRISFVCSGRKKKKAYDEKLRRLVTIISQLANGGTVTAAELAGQFKVSKRTIQRDMEFLSEINWPIYPDNGTYKFTEGFSLRKITVTPEEKFLISLFYRLFSQAKQPFSETAKNLLDKVVIASDRNDPLFDEISSQYKKKVVEEEIANFSDLLAVRLENLNYPQSFVRKIGAYLDDVEQKIKTLSAKDSVDIKTRFIRKYENNKPVALIWAPKTYFKDDTLKFDFLTNKKDREFQIRTHLPNKYIKSFRISLSLHMAFNYWGTHFKARDLTCFDDFAKYMGFPAESKRFVYEFSHGTHTKKHQILITTASLYWEKEINMPNEEIKPFLQRKSGY